MKPSAEDSSDASEPPENSSYLSQVPETVIESVRIVVIVGLLGLMLFTVTGSWPPMVAVESGSMEPVLERADMVVVVDTERYVGDGAHGDTGIVTATVGEETGYTSLGAAGDVIIYQANGEPDQQRIIHRSMFWVEDGENWVDSEKSNPAFIRNPTCDTARNCPAPHDGFITKGDANAYYDQSMGLSAPVKADWVHAKAKMKIPYVGWLRLAVSGR